MCWQANPLRGLAPACFETHIRKANPRVPYADLMLCAGAVNRYAQTSEAMRKAAPKGRDKPDRDFTLLQDCCQAQLLDPGFAGDAVQFMSLQASALHLGLCPDYSCVRVRVRVPNRTDTVSGRVTASAICAGASKGL